MASEGCSILLVKVYLRGFATVFLLAGILLGLLALRRSRLPYNEQGRYFDAEVSVVYKDSAVVAYGMMAAAGLTMGSLLLGASFLGRHKRGPTGSNNAPAPGPWE